MSATDILIITPSFHEAGGGAAVYYRLLTQSIRRRGATVEVIGDIDGAKGDPRYYGLFPRRCDMAGRGMRNRLAYLAQNLAYLRLPALIAARRPRAVLIHSSFLNFPGLFPRVLARIEERSIDGEMRLVGDVRDQLLPTGSIRRLRSMEQVVACSENIVTHLLRHGLPRDQIRHIPVIQEPLAVDDEEAAKTVRRLGLTETPFMLCSGLVKEEKGIDILLEAYHRHFRPKKPEVRLAICGQLKTARKDIVRGLKGPGVSYLGPQERRVVLHLASRSALNVCVSRSEGMPRTSLESLALDRPTLLPRGVPEFDTNCADFVAESYEPADVAALMQRLLEARVAPTYPIEQHRPEAVLDEYWDVLGLSDGNRTS